jgi:hypothetical protein
MEALPATCCQSGPLGPEIQTDTMLEAKSGKREKDGSPALYFCFLNWRGCRDACFFGRLDQDKKILPFFKKLLTI